MSRVTYFHHYMPALYFAIFLLGFMVERGTAYLSKPLRTALYLVLFGATIGLSAYFSPVWMGMGGEPSDFDYLQWLSSWKMGA